MPSPRPRMNDPRPEMAERVKRLEKLLRMIVPVPEEWFGDEKIKTDKHDLHCAPCSEYKTLFNSWRKALKWTDGLDRALSVMLASVMSTRSIGDQLWVKVIGPASCGKSTLCEALSVNTRHVLAKSTIRGFHSGYKSDSSGDEDNSLVALLYGKTLVTKDGDTLLQSPNLGQILSEARDLYDSTSRTHYRNKMSKDYQGVRMTWILCGTSSLRSIDSSELGERFLDCVIMEGIDDELEDEILWRVANRADRNMAIEANGKMETQYEPELVEAMRLTGGYIDYLRENAQEILGAISVSKPALRQCMLLGKFVAYMRARPSERQDETAEREFAARLVSQMTRLAKCLAGVLNRPEVDAEVLRRVRRVALDTGRGKTCEMVRYLHERSEGAEVKGIAMEVNLPEVRTRELLRFLRQIGVTEAKSRKVSGVSTAPRWFLTERLRDLYEQVTCPVPGEEE